MYSMRSRETGLYDIFKDGNFQLTLARMLAMPKGTEIFFSYPINSTRINITQLESLTEFAKSKGIILRSFFAWYGDNPMQTRQGFFDINFNSEEHNLLSTLKNIKIKSLSNSTDVTHIVTDICGIHNLDIHKNIHIKNNFNVTSINGVSRPYVDDFFDEDLKSIKRAHVTTVLNQVQVDHIGSSTADGLTHRVYVDNKIINPAVYEFFDSLVDPSVEEDRNLPIKKKTIFWPFRLTDKDYMFYEFIDKFEQQHLYEEYDIVVTDPNDSLCVEAIYLSKFTPSKAEYYKILKMKPIIVMLDDVDITLHPGTLEFLYFDCPLVCYENNVIDTPFSIKSLDEIGMVLSKVHEVENKNNIDDFLL